MTDIPVINAAQAAEALRHIDVKAAMRQIFLNLSAGHARQPAQKVVLLPDNKGDFINYFGVDMASALIGVKVSPYLVKATAPVITAWTLLMSTETGMPLMLCDSAALTTARTAATTALAVDLLAPAQASTLCIIGTGAVGRAHLRYALSLRNWRAISMWSPSFNGSVEQLGLDADIPPGLVTIATSLEQAIADVDVLMMCTSSATPVIDTAALSKPCLITSISTNAPGAHEIDPAALPEMDVYCDYRATTPAAAGEMVIAAQETNWQPSLIAGDLPELVSGTCAQPTFQRHVYFRSVGLGLEDVAIAHCVMNYLKQQETQ